MEVQHKDRKCHLKTLCSEEQVHQHPPCTAAAHPSECSTHLVIEFRQ